MEKEYTNGFSREERLKSRRLLGELMESRLSFVAYPFRVVVKQSSDPANVTARMAISVAKKRFKRAVHRNQVKRLTREAYRLQKSELYPIIESHIDTTLDILLIYLDKEIPTLQQLQSSMRKLRTKLDNCLAKQKLQPKEEVQKQ